MVYVTQITMTPAPVEVQAHLVSMQSDLTAGDRSCMQVSGAADLDIFIEAVPVPLLEESKGHPLLHDARPDSAPEQLPLFHHLTPPACAIRYMFERNARAGHAGRARAGSCQEMQSRRVHRWDLLLVVAFTSTSAIVIMHITSGPIAFPLCCPSRSAHLCKW